MNGYTYVKMAPAILHKNGQKKDNRLENLQLRQGKHGTGVIYHCNACGSFDVSAQPIADSTEDTSLSLVFADEQRLEQEPLSRFDLPQLTLELG